MGQNKDGPVTSIEERSHRRLQIVYTKKTRERQIFMEELYKTRKHREKRTFKTLRALVGPGWYQALSVPQRVALDSLSFSIYQDLLEGRPVRTANVMRQLGLYPRPNMLDLMNCVYLGRDDPKEMLAQLFLMTYGHSIDGKRPSYNLNGRLMLSGILYLGLEDLIKLLRQRFYVEPEVVEPPPKPKPKIEPPLKSPYLQKMVAVYYQRPKRIPFKPAKLPNLDDLNGPYEEVPVIRKPPPPIIPPPPKKKLPRSYCDKLAGVLRIEPHSSANALSMKTVVHTSHRKLRGSKMYLTETKKTYGMGSLRKPRRRKKPVAPSTGMCNAQYTINGVFIIRGKTTFVLGNVAITPAEGDLIHGGYGCINGEVINIHCGYRGNPPTPPPDPCNCMKKWKDTVFQYVKRTKCYCGHHFDYGNEGTFSPDELPFFQKPTANAPFMFNYHRIFDLDDKRLHIEGEFQKLWATDSMLIDDTAKNVKDKKTKKIKRSSTTCLGQKPKPEDYLKCALRLMKRINIAARLPDIHLVPELIEWMRRRIYGPFSRAAKENHLLKSKQYWQSFHAFAMRGYGHVAPPQEPIFVGKTNWLHKFELQSKFEKITQKYKVDLFRSYAYVTNLMWPSMCQAQFPDKKFRDIYFSYLYGRLEDLQLMHPYSKEEANKRRFLLAQNRYRCLPAGVELQE